MMYLNDPAPSVAGIERGDLYRMTSSYQSCIRDATLGLSALRLIHLITHDVCRRTPEWHGVRYNQPDGGYRINCVGLRLRLGLERSRGNRALTDGLDELRATGFFEWIEPVNGNTWLSWRMQDEFHDLLFAHHAYGYYDIRALAGLRTPLDIRLRDDMAIVRMQRKPEMDYGVSRLAAWADRPPSWHRAGAAITTALTRTAVALGVDLVAHLGCIGTVRGIDHVRVRLRHSHTKWTGRLMAAPASICARKVLLITRGGSCSSIAPAEAPEAAERLFIGRRTARSA